MKVIYDAIGKAYRQDLEYECPACHSKNTNLYQDVFVCFDCKTKISSDEYKDYDCYKRIGTNRRPEFDKEVKSK